MEKQRTCEDRVQEYWASVRADLARFMDGETVDDGEFNEYGLSFDYVEPGTFDEQPAGYYRYQFSWGGPSDELRAFGDGRIEYWFLDWGDGASLDVSHDEVPRWAFGEFQEFGMMEHFNGLVQY